MAPITIDMIRRRAEHNDGVLETLEELVLQEESIDKIEILGRLCPNLKILYMPNNLIPRLENMNRLKGLEYLNLAINNIVTLDGLAGCESLNKLDLTLNFIDKEGLLTALKLRENHHLKELFLSGNPCTDWPGYRKYVIAAVPSLKHLDAIKIKPSERIIAQQDFEQLHAELLRTCTAKSDDGINKLDLEAPQLNEKGEEVREYTVANRVKEHEEMERMREEQGNKSKSKSGETKSKRRSGFEALPTEGRIYQKNEGSFDFRLVESDCGRLVQCDVAVGRYLDTSLIDVDVQPNWLRILVKGKLLQLRLPCEVKTDESSVQRSTTTGHLLVTLPKVVPDSKRSGSHSAAPAVPHLKPKEGKNLSTMTQRSRDKNSDASAAVNIHDIVVKSSERIDATPKYEQQKSELSKYDAVPMGTEHPGLNWEDDVPPLE